ncbi:MAG: YidC/Oxa1 family membrane protein insertase, partial [Synergistaceae bacterium]|nr:YidC/Oxa1 family membrane protein insertase [Synergistaceae bacterium]
MIANFLYTICVLPFETVFRYLYAALYYVSGSYGISLILMSLASTAAIGPFMRYASRAQLRERHMQDILRPQLDKIKAESAGFQRHNRINELYRRYAYHPIYSIRSAFGVLIQVPLLLGAYYMLRGHESIVSQAFGIISDLSRPDALFFGLNLLPVLMTVINMSSACVTPG